MCSLAKKLKKLREINNMQKNEVAAIVGVHPSSIGNLEKGSLPKADLLYSLSKYFNISMDVLMDESISENELTQFIGLQKIEMTGELKSILALYSKLTDGEKIEIEDWMQFKVLKHNQMELSTSRDGRNTAEDKAIIA